ncbi:DMT family transporter [Alkalibacter mobilis]|uniref:DMT family transporter n=1 Tax=Alkalibacter mobilis TaxID=2787712 RepID=UPI0018A04B80|nr:DMT family transporter [Alkalibacter mobilis]MBF7096658.1 EamA family transporter [Alkalibacter mobilis]
MKSKQERNAYFKYIFALLLFGSNGIVASYISLTSYEIVLFRTLIGSLFLIGIFLFMRNRFTFWNKKKDLFFLVISGVAMGAGWMFLYEAYMQIGVSIASLAYYCGPVIVMVLSPFLFKEKLTRPKVIGFLVVLAGIFLINGGALGENKNTWGMICGMMSAVTYALMVIFNKKAKGITGLENSTLQLFISFLTLAVFVSIKQGLVINVESEDLLPILILGLINTGVGCYLYFSSIGHLPVQTVSIFGYLEPLSAVVLSVFILGESMLPSQIIGALFILGGAIFGEILGNKFEKYFRFTLQKKAEVLELQTDQQ